MVKVLDADEVSLLGTLFRRVGMVQPILLNQTIPQINTGEGDPSRTEKASKWHFANCKGGMGKYRLNLAAQDATDRFWDSTLSTDTGEITLLPLVTEATALGFTTAVSAKPVVFSGSIYFFAASVGAGGFVRRFNGTNYQYYCTFHNAWETMPVGVGPHVEVALPDTPVSAMVFNGYLFIWCGTDYAVYDGGTTWVLGHAPTIPSRYAVEWDNTLVIVDLVQSGATTRNVATIYRSSNGALTTPWLAGATWGATAYLREGEPTGMCIGEDGDGNPAPMVGSTKGRYIVDVAAGHAYPLGEHFNEVHADNCKGLAAWDAGASQVYGKGGSVYQYVSAGRGAQLVDIGPNKDDGLISTRLGRIVDIDASMGHMLIAAMDASSTAGQYSSVMKYDRGGWHTLAIADAAAESIKYVCFSTVGSSRLWFSQGNAVFWFPHYDTSANPRQISGMTYTASGDFITAWFGLNTMPSTAIDIPFYCQGMSSTEKATVSLGLANDDASWLEVGTITANGQYVISLGSHKGINFYNLRIKIHSERGSTTTLTPRIIAGTLRWVPAPDALWGWRMQLDLSSTYKGKTPQELRDAIRDMCRGTIGVFSFRPNDDRYVKVEEAQAVEESGHGESGRWQVTVSEQVAASWAHYFKWDGNSKWDGTHKWS